MIIHKDEAKASQLNINIPPNERITHTIFTFG